MRDTDGSTRCGCSGRTIRSLRGPLATALLAIATPAAAADYTVATTGDDAQAGTEAAPFRTIQHAADVADRGDAVHVLPGTYDEGVTLSRSGGEGSPITFVAEGRVAMTPPGAGTAFTVEADYVILDGFTLDPPTGSAVDIWGHHVTVRSFVIQNATDAVSAWVVAFVNHGNYNTFTHNTIQDVVGLEAVAYVWGHDVTISNNLVSNYRWGESGVHADFVQTFGCPGWESYAVLVENNVIRDSDNQLFNIEPSGGWDGQRICDETDNPGFHDWTFRNNVIIRLNMQGNTALPRTHVYNNVFYASGLWNGFALAFYPGSDDSDVYDNVILSGSAAIANNGVALTVDYNYVGSGEDGSLFEAIGFAQEHGIDGGDPGFVDVGADDFHLLATSPLVGAGLALAPPFADADGNARPAVGAWDIGAYQRCEGSDCGPSPDAGVPEDAGASCDLDIPVAPGPTDFSLPCTGTYALRGLVRAQSDGTNSFFVDIDQDPAGVEERTWDLDVGATFEEQDVSWRGEGCSTETCAELDPKTWALTAGDHTLYLAEREPGTEIQRMRFIRTDGPDAGTHADGGAMPDGGPGRDGAPGRDADDGASGDGCGCRVPSGALGGAHLSLLGLVALAVLVGRRRSPRDS